MDVAMSPAPPSIEQDLEKEVELIHRTAEKQLASVNGLNASLAKKILKAEAQTNALLEVNKSLEAKNADLVVQLHRAQDDVRNLSLKEARLDEVEKKYAEATSAVVNAELNVKKSEAHLDAVVAERDTMESELSTSRLKIEELERQLNSELEKAENDRNVHQQDIQQRSLQIAAITEEKDNHEKIKQELEQQLAERDVKITQAEAQHNQAIKEKEDSLVEAERNVKVAEAQLEELKFEADSVSKQLETVKKERDGAVDEKNSLSDKVTEMTEKLATVESQISKSEAELQELKETITKTEEQRDEYKSQLDGKISEAAAVASEIALLREDRDKLSTKAGELEQQVETISKDVESKKLEIESRNLVVTSMESERNLLSSEKASLEKDYADARDRATLLEREKGGLEKRVCELEEVEKRLNAKIKSAEQEKVTLIATHEKELHARIAEQQAQFELDTAALRKELDDVVDRHAAMHRAEVQRETAAAEAVKVEEEKKDDDDVNVTKVDDDDIALVEEVEEVGKDEVDEPAATRAIAMAVPGKVEEDVTDGMEGVKEVEDDDEIIDVDDAEKDTAGNKGEAVAVTMDADVPEAPIPFVADVDVQERDGLEEGGTATLTRDDIKVEDDVEEVKDVLMGGAGAENVTIGEGNTSGIVSEEVVNEEVVDEGEDVLEEVDEEEPVPADEAEAAEKKKMAFLAAATGGNIQKDVTEDLGEAAKDEGKKAMDKVDDTIEATRGGVTSAMDKAKDNVGSAVRNANETAQNATTPMTNAADKGRRTGSRMLNRMMCCVKVEEGQTEPATRSG